MGKFNFRGLMFTAVALLAMLSGLSSRAIAQPPEPPTVAEDSPFLRPRTPCPQDLETLIQGLLRDLPSYANRVARRSLGLREETTGFGTILIAGQAEFMPLDISTLTFGGDPAITAEDVEQVFFTTLERRYTEDDSINLEEYHWLFLTAAEDGWRLALMFSRLSPDESTIRPPTPPRESSDGIIGQAVQLWLRDCRAGATYPVETADEEDAIGR